MTEPTTTTTKPLHIQVAEALEPGIDVVLGYPQNVSSVCDDGSFPSPVDRGIWYTRRWLTRDHDCPYAWDNDPCECVSPRMEKVRRYDTDWSATGPLIESLKISLEAEWCGADGEKWMAYVGAAAPRHRNGLSFAPTALEAVCRLIVSLAAAGKLERTR